MLFNCLICAELINPSDDAHATVCGHIFHYVCILQWLERSKTCPQCRNKCTATNIRRIYFNIANVDTTENHVNLLQQQLENTSLRLKTVDKELKEIQKQNEDLKIMQKKSVKTISKLEDKAEKYEMMVTEFPQMVNALNNERKVVEEQRKHINELKQQIELMSTVQAILDSSAKDIELILKDENDPKTLAIMITTLRRELRQSENKKSDIRHSLKAVQNDLRRIRDEKNSLQEKVAHFESENFTLKEKIKVLENEKNTDSFNASNNSTCDLITKESPSVSSNSFSKISPKTYERVKKIEEADSPYFNIKSSGIGVLRNLPKKSKSKPSQDGLTSILKRTSSDLSEKYSIFKKPRLEATSTKTLNSSLVFNGFGSSERKESILNFEILNKKKPTVSERVKSGKLKKPS